MDNTTVFSKTGKGLLEVKNRSNRISKEQYRVLSLIDGKANLDELADRARMNPTALRTLLTQLTDGGFVKVLVSSTSNDPGLGAGAATGSYYVDDLDFTAVLGPAGAPRPSIYQSTETERRQRESAERKAAEAASSKRREEEERRKQAEAAKLAKEEALARQVREAAERKASLEAQRVAQLEAELKARIENERKLKEAAAAKARAEAEAKIKAELDRQIRESNLRKQQEDEARRRKEEEERLRREAEEKARREAEERRRQEEEARKRKEEEERLRREAEERRRQEEEARKRKEEEERLRREAEEKARREAEERRRQEEDARKRKEEEELLRRQAEETARRDAEERRRQEEEARKRKQAEEHLRREAEEKARQEALERRRREDEARQETERAEALAEQRRLEEAVRRRKSAKQRQRDVQSDEDFGDLAPVIGTPGADDEETWLRRELGIQGDLPIGAVKPEVTVAARDKGPGDASPRSLGSSTLPPAQSVPEQPGRLAAIATEQAGEPADTELVPETVEVVEVVEVVEEVVLESAAPSPFDPGVKEASPGILDLDIGRALEEQERRLRMEEEARAALERAEREAQEKAEREAREVADAAERSRREDALRAREEADRQAREEKERRELEEEERRRQREFDRRAREQARQESERRKREEDLARQRKEQEEREQRKAERDRVQKEIRRSHITPARVIAGAVVVMLLLMAAVVQFASLSAWAPDIERLASQRLGEPVRIGAVRANLLPQFQLVLENVSVGVAQDVQARTVVLSPQLGSMFSERKSLDELQVQGVTGSIEALARARDWLKGPSAKPDLVSVPIVKVSDLTLSIPGVSLPTLKLTVKLGQGGALLGAFASTSDEHLEVDFLPRESDTEVTLRGRNFTLPVGPAVEVMDVQGKGSLSAGALHLANVEYFMLGGQGKAEISAHWSDGWHVETNFDLQRFSLDASMRALKYQLVSEGSLDAKGVARMRAQRFDALFSKPEITANFTVSRGNLGGLDLPRALQQRSREGVQGGQTRFEELSGVLQTREGAYQYRSMKLQAGVLKAAGQADISAEGVVSGRVQSELRSSAGLIRGGFSLAGNDQAMILKQ